MKIFGLKYKVLLGIISVLLLSVDFFYLLFMGLKDSY